MAELFHRSGFSFAIAHCNFALRGKESDDDELFCEELAQRLKVAFLSKRFDTGRFAVENKLSIQAAARKLRYDWFEECLKKEKFRWVATGHQKNDVLETMLINFTRGTGIGGLHGILPRQGNIIRPMLFASRHEIEVFAEMQQIRYRYDSSNASEKYSRNKIRMRVIPVLKEINPSIEHTAISVSKNLYAAEQVLKNHLENEKKKCFSVKGKKNYLSIRKLKQLKPVNAYLFEFLRGFGFNARLCEQVADSIDEPPGKKFYSDTHQVVKDREYLIISEKREEDFPEIEIERKARRILKPVSMSFYSGKITKKFVIPGDKNSACLDYNRLKFPLILRKWQFGDRFVPLGMNGKKKVSDFLVDNKIPVTEKQDVWVLASGHDIVWVVGHRIDDRYKITPASRKAFIARRASNIF
jgi:tRNA(Ile)-lysidine synthase